MNMLSAAEKLHLRILRITVASTASIALFGCVVCLLYAAYAVLWPEPRPNLYGRIEEFRIALDPTKLLKEVFGEGSEVTKSVVASAKNVQYESTAASDDAIVKQMNLFLSSVYGATFEDSSKFAEWLHGEPARRINLSWSKSIDDEASTNENNINFLLRSLLFDYAKKLSADGVALAKEKQANLNSASFDRLVAPTGNQNAPYYIVWFFDQLRAQLRSVDEQLSQQRLARNALRLTALPSLMVAAGSLGYYIVSTFCFLFISIEASLREMAQKSYRTNPDIEQSTLPK